MPGVLKFNSSDLPMSDAIISITARLLAGGRIFSDDEHCKGLKDTKETWVGWELLLQILVRLEHLQKFERLDPSLNIKG